MAGYIGLDNTYGAFEKQVIVPDGLNAEFTLQYRVASPNQIMVVQNGQLLEPGPGADYSTTEAGKKIVFSTIPPLLDQIYLIYLGRQLSVSKTTGLEPVYHNDEGTGSQTDFTLPIGPVVPDALIVFVDRVQQRLNDDFIVSGSHVIFTVAPGAGEEIDFYIHGVERADLAYLDDEIITTPRIHPRAVTPDKINFTWQNYLPTIETFGSMTFSNLDIHEAKYIDLGHLIKLHVHFTLDLAGSPLDPRVRLSLPINNNGSGNAAGHTTLTTATELESGFLLWGGVDSYDIHRQHGVNFTNDAWEFQIKTEYEPETP